MSVSAEMAHSHPARSATMVTKESEMDVEKDAKLNVAAGLVIILENPVLKFLDEP